MDLESDSFELIELLLLFRVSVETAFFSFNSVEGEETEFSSSGGLDLFLERIDLMDALPLLVFWILLAIFFRGLSFG